VAGKDKMLIVEGEKCGCGPFDNHEGENCLVRKQQKREEEKIKFLIRAFDKELQRAAEE